MEEQLMAAFITENGMELEICKKNHHEHGRLNSFIQNVFT